MELIFDEVIDNELKTYLLSQEGIIDVKLNHKDFQTILNIEYNDKTNAQIIMKYIDIFTKNDTSYLLSFNKNTKEELNTYNYFIKEICCSFCLKNYIKDLFMNDNIYYVKTDYNLKDEKNININIKYNMNYNEEELKNYLDSKLEKYK